MKLSGLIAQARESKIGLELVRDMLLESGALAKANVAVRAIVAVDELIFALDDARRAEARANYRAQVLRDGTAPPDSPTGAGNMSGRGPGEGPG